MRRKLSGIITRVALFTGCAGDAFFPETTLNTARVLQKNGKQTGDSAEVTAEIQMVVLSPFTACSPIASNCTGTCWDLNSGRPKSTLGSRAQFQVGYRVRIEKSFAFQKKDGGWRCNSTAIQPVEMGIALSGP